ncbi:hypothetical protein [Cupriavidus sp. TMH.W2]|uniref:hypothetical protein n=1 Tax=Cupriavidus sp. TMH.W2 TaxID=3434465 RepID=UPI003D772325
MRRQANEAAGAPGWRLGLAEGRPVRLPQRFCLRTIGARRSGRTLALAALGEQTLAQGGAVLWMDGHLHPPIGATLRQQAQRHSVPFCTTDDSTDDPAVVAQLFARGGVGHCVPNRSHGELPVWRARTARMLRAIAARDLGASLGPILFVFNEIAGRYAGEALGLAGLPQRLRAAGHNLVFSDPEIAQEATDVAAYARQFLFHRVETAASCHYAQHVIGPWPAAPSFMGFAWGSPSYRSLEEDLRLLEWGHGIWYADGKSRLIRAEHPTSFARATGPLPLETGRH